VREPNEAVLNARVDGAVRESSIRLPLAGGNAAERRDRFVHGANRMDVKTTVRYGVHDVLSQHQMLDVVRRDQYALTSRQALLTTEIEKPFDFLVDAADSLYAAVLIDRSGDRQGLRHGNVRQGRQEGARLGQRRAVALDHSVGLLEYERGAQRQRRFGGVTRADVRGQRQDALAVDGAAEFYLPCDVQNFAFAKTNGRGDARRPTESETAEIDDREPIDLRRGDAVRLDHDRVLQHLLQHLLAEPVLPSAL